LSLAAAIEQTGLAGWIGAALSALAEWPVFAVILVVTTVVIFSRATEGFSSARHASLACSLEPSIS